MTIIALSCNSRIPRIDAVHAGFVDAVQSGKKDCARLQKLLECSKMAEEVAAAEKRLKAVQKQEDACKVLPSGPCCEQSDVLSCV